MNGDTQAPTIDATTPPTASVPVAGSEPEVPSVDGRSSRWARHREQRRAEMLDIARHLIHAQGPDVTMEDIAAASGTSKSIVYRYFADKAQLQRAIGMHILSGMHRRLVQQLDQLEADSGAAAGPEQRIRAMISAYVAAAEASPHVYRFVTRPSEGLNHFLVSVARLVATALPSGIPAASAQVWSSGAVGFVQGAVDRWMTAEDEAPSHINAEELTDELLAWLMHGILPHLKENHR
ncbi:TetR/AcrR family transcriptional regulator [Brachybacterium sp. AOP25-B2-12]|uniref:TetR/AcrR family transcriptional regulator n=1 Tax=Brachybacterium sp. AOP25-B2-12 TaxID=3457710 RepID=UPI004033E41E